MATRAQQFDILATGVTYNAALITVPYVKFLEAGLSSTKDAWEDKDKSVAITKKALDAQGRATVYGDGIYKLEFYTGDPDSGGAKLFEIDNYKCVAVFGNTQTITATRFGTVDDSFILADTTSANASYVPPDAADCEGRSIVIKKLVSANTLTILPQSPNTIDGETQKALTLKFSTVEIVSDGTNWYSSKGDADTVDGIHTKTLSIGAWNMDSTASVTVAHGLTLANIRNVSAMIISDDALTHYPIDHASPGVNGGLPSGNWKVGGTNVTLERYASSVFDSTDFDSLGATRGYILVQYVD